MLRQILVFLTFSTPVLADDAGQALFQRHCAACHGAGAAGNGPMAASLNPQPSDLTQLAARNGGVFPLARVVARIDGTETLVAHGSPMPVFAGFFEGAEVVILGADGEVAQVPGPVAELVDWLISVQVAAE
ncbi:MAG: hypothetical protein RLZZ528_1222 [Pseudomonadota bacterium]|jgi:mono/diheme cytochrome c family protein